MVCVTFLHPLVVTIVQNDSIAAHAKALVPHQQKLSTFSFLKVHHWARKRLPKFQRYGNLWGIHDSRPHVLAKDSRSSILFSVSSMTGERILRVRELHTESRFCLLGHRLERFSLLRSTMRNSHWSWSSGQRFQRTNRYHG